MRATLAGQVLKQTPFFAAVLAIAMCAPVFGGSDSFVEIKIIGEGPFQDLSEVRAILNNSGSGPIYLHPRAGVPFAQIECHRGRWWELGAPLPWVDTRSLDDSSALVVAPGETVSLLIPHEHAISSHRRQGELYEAGRKWREGQGLEGGPAEKPRCSFPGTFRLRVMFSTGVWIDNTTLGRIDRVMSPEFLVDSGEPAN